MQFIVVPQLRHFKNAYQVPNKKSNNLFYLGKCKPSIYHARLRMGCSKLNAHLCFNLKVIPSPRCTCGCPVEDPQHYLFYCPLFLAQRLSLMNTVLRISNNINLQTLLYGDPDISFEANSRLFGAVHNYILDTHRFDWWILTGLPMFPLPASHLTIYLYSSL